MERLATLLRNALAHERWLPIVLPLAKIALEAHALGYPEARDDAPLDLLAGLFGSFARSPKLLRIDTGGRQIGRAQRCRSKQA